MDPDETFLHLLNTRFGGQLNPLMDYLTNLHSQGARMVIVSRQADRLSHLWKEQVGARAGRPGPEFVQGSLGEGWTLTPASGARIHLLSDGEIFGWRRPQPISMRWRCAWIRASRISRSSRLWQVTSG